MKVFFGVPSYKGVRCVPFFESLDATVKAVENAGYETALSVLQGSCYVQVARNELVKEFLKSDAEVLFFVDDDLSWYPEDALKLIRSDDDVVAGIYPYKTDVEDYPVVIRTLPETHYPFVRDDGCIQAFYLPTGFMRVKREVFLKISAAYPHLAYGTYDRDGVDTGTAFDYFPQGVKDGRWVGEDFAFCRLWNDLGGTMWIIPDMELTHHGEYTMTGNYHRYLMRQPKHGEVAA